MHDSKVTGALEIVHVPVRLAQLPRSIKRGIVDDPFAFRGAFDLIDPGGKVNQSSAKNFQAVDLESETARGK